MVDEIICWCAGITRKEIEEAVKRGARTEKEVRDTLNKWERGKCKEKNPKGVCCSTDFAKAINEILQGNITEGFECG
ncbi:conserved hypothetical protein [Thermosulfidibacter takaii ABI70S6]|uniref:BFD-like [2Fe-2S]-binding domain-containing protein n=1 Tax=Thermosulfidibacter takaii (strain DSM 17441 / JCM 13301 / NBRC 103674 / ABI70S6) TaxID=1298851 RepID=A0A0S3QVN3_THET7|nr:(2Fe-2S)-binding protein [Thermosulfidibacter takaii]BAT72382.1 conserved hypothetical protein [Thermosulfidibacter takaii ABI70S6]